MCYGACGMLVDVAAGRVVEIKGDPDSPVSRGILCPKGRASLELLYHPQRLHTPLQRVGARGAGRFEALSWDLALDRIADELARAKSSHGPQSVAFAQGSAKGLIDEYNERFANYFGTPNFTSAGNVCFLPRLFASKLTCGSYTIPDYDHPPDLLLLWGVNLAETRTGEHGQALAALKKKTRLMVVDPIRTPLAKRAAIWLAVRPGADLALALGMLQVIIAEKLYDAAFVQAHTVGFEELRAQVAAYTPQRVAEITWIDPEQIKAAARLYATAKTAAIQWGNAVDHGVNSFQTARAICMLRVVTGNLDRPGGDILPQYPLTGSGAMDLSGKAALPNEIWEQRVDAQRKLLPFFRRVLPHSITNAILDEEPYAIKSMFVHAANPLLTHTNTGKTIQALEKLDFLAVSEMFMTPTAALADIVLPAATFLEYDSIVAPPYYPHAVIQQQVTTIPQCRSDFAIKNALAQRLGLGEHFYTDMKTLFNEILQPAGITYEDFREIGVLTGPKIYRKFEAMGFDTPSGKVELYSEQLAGWGFAPLPDYVEPPETPYSDSDLADDYPLILTSKKSIYYLHSGGRQIDALRRKHPHPRVWIHPETAAALGIRDRDEVWIETKRGRIRQKALLTDKLDPRVVCVDFGWWFPEEGAGEIYGWQRANLNILTDDEEPVSPETGSANLRGLLCKVYRT